MIYLIFKMFYVALQAGFSYYQGDSFIPGWFLNVLMHKFLPNYLKTVTNSWYSEIDFSGYGLVSFFSTTPHVFWCLLFSSLFIQLSIHPFIWFMQYSEIDFSGYGLVSFFSTTPHVFWCLLFSSLFIQLSIHPFIWSFILQYSPWTHCVLCCRYTGAQGRHTASVTVLSSRCKQTSHHQIAI